MDYSNPDNPITAAKSKSNWYAQTISRKALLSIPDEFKQVPKLETLTFKQRDDFSSSVNARWPKETSQMVLALETFDGPSLDVKPPVYVFLHGPRNHHIGFVWVKPDLSVHRLQRRQLRDVEFEEPFCDLGDGSLEEHTIYNRIRAMALYCFLDAGYIKEVGDYNHFWYDFMEACKWIANKGSCPTPPGKVLKQNSVPIFTASLEPDLDSMLGTIASKKRGSNEEFEPVSARIKRRDYSHTASQIDGSLQLKPASSNMDQSRATTPPSSSPKHPHMTTSVQAQLWDSQAENSQLKASIEMQRRSIELLQARVAVNHQLQAQVKSLTAEVSHINSELAYSRNAYRGIQVQHDDFVVRHTKALDDAKGLREQFDQNQLRCTQAEKRLTVLETELESLRNKMRKAREVLDDSAL